MRSETIRLYKGVHTWTGLLTGMALFVAFYAGALTLFKAPLNGWAQPPAAQVPLTLDEASRLVEQVVATGVTDFTLHLQQHPQHPWPLTWQPRVGNANSTTPVSTHRAPWRPAVSSRPRWVSWSTCCTRLPAWCPAISRSASP